MLPYLDECEVTITSNDPTVVTRSRSGRKVVRNLEQQRWELDVSWPDFLDGRACDLEVALDMMKGQSGIADIVHPVRSYHSDASGIWSVVNSANPGADLLTLAGTGVLTVGHYIRFYNHSKVYRVVAQDGAAYSIYPSLRKQVFASEQVFVSGVAISCTRTDDAISYKRSGPLTKISASFEEQL